MAEWLGRALQKLLQRFESARDLLKPPILLEVFLFVIASPYQAKLSCLTKEESKPLLMRFLPLVEMTLFS